MWLWAVTEAEQKLGSGTGKLKLSMVYGMFLGKFPWIAPILPFEKFSDLVTEALVTMRNILASNKAAQVIVYGDEAVESSMMMMAITT